MNSFQPVMNEKSAVTATAGLANGKMIFVILLAYGIWQNRVSRATEGI